MNASLQKERQFTAKLGSDAAKAKEQLASAMQSTAQLSAANATLEGQLAEEQ